MESSPPKKLKISSSKSTEAAAAPAPKTSAKVSEAVKQKSSAADTAKPVKPTKPTTETAPSKPATSAKTAEATPAKTATKTAEPARPKTATKTAEAAPAKPVAKTTEVTPKSSKKVVKEPEPESEEDDDDDDDYDEDDDVVDFDNLSDDDEEEDETDDESGDDEHETVIDGTDEVFDLDQFKNGSSFDQDRAEKAFGEWKAKRSKKPAAWFTSIKAPEVDEDAFIASRRQMTQRLIQSYKDKLAKVEEALSKPEGLTKGDLKELKTLQAQYQSNIAVRELELSRK